MNPVGVFGYTCEMLALFGLLPMVPTTPSLPVFSTHLSILLGFILAVVLIVRLVREQRPTGSTFAWLLAILLIPYVGVPLYILLGGRKLARMAGHKSPLYGGNGFRPDIEFFNDTERILLTTGAPPPTFGNQVEHLPDGETAYHRLMEMIASAKESIDVTVFILGRDEVGQRFVEALAERAAAGVKVRLLVDALGSLRTRGRFLAPLRKAGGQVGVFMPMLPLRRKWSANLRNHRKLIVVDAKTAYLGGMNFAGEYMGPRPDPKRWTDFGLVLEGPVVREVACVFVSDWSFATGENLAWPAAPQTIAPDCSAGVMQLVAAGPDVASDPLYHGLLSAFAEARQRIWIVTPYFIPDGVIAEMLILAARLGRDVRILVPRRSNHLLADLARGSYMRDLMRAGVKFHGFPGMLHAKIVVIDDTLAITGSANLDLRSLYLNYEIGLFIHSRVDVDRIASHVLKLFSRSRAISAPGNSARERAVAWLEDAGRLLAPLL